MGVLDESNAELVIYPEVEHTDSYGNTSRRATDVGVTVPATLVQHSADIDTNQPNVAGQRTVTAYRVRVTRGHEHLVPVGPWSRITWDGRDWDVDGEVDRHNRSPATARITFTMRARAPRPVGAG